MKHFRLALVRQKYRPDGGAERFVARALEALEGEDLDLNVITREWLGETNPNWHIHLCDPMKWGRVSREQGFANAARQIWNKEKFDIVQSHERIAGCDIYRAGDGVHRHWLLQRSRLLPQWRGQLLMADRFHRYVMRAEQEMYAAPELKAVICNAQMIKNEIMADFGLADEKISVIYNAIDSQKFLPATESLRHQLRQQFDIPPSAHCMIFVGSGFERKGLEAAIRATALTESMLLVVGQDKDEKRYRALANTLGCVDRVRFAGVQKHTLPFYQAADALLLPTLYDPFPNVILEAMSCGLPVITSATCGGSEFIVQGENGFICDALDIKALAESIRALPTSLFDSGMSLAARTRIMKETPARLSEQLINLYKKILD
ncbi:glycosyltransferase family 4 protein [Ewingella sp. S1.OA.A_B6]